MYEYKKIIVIMCLVLLCSVIIPLGCVFSESTKPRSEILYNQDFNGDGRKEKIILEYIYHKGSNGSEIQYYYSRVIEFIDSVGRKHKLFEWESSSEFETKVEDFNNDHIKDIFIKVDSGGTQSNSNFYIYGFKKDNAKKLLDSSELLKIKDDIKISTEDEVIKTKRLKVNSKLFHKNQSIQLPKNTKYVVVKGADWNLCNTTKGNNIEGVWSYLFYYKKGKYIKIFTVKIYSGYQYNKSKWVKKYLKLRVLK